MHGGDGGGRRGIRREKQARKKGEEVKSILNNNKK
jgi:hypothetical protein